MHPLRLRRRATRRKLAAITALAGIGLLFSAGAASAHPLGNFTVNTYSGLRIQPDRVVVDLVVDMAEIPAFQARHDTDTDGDGAVSAAEGDAYATRQCADAATKVSVAVGGRATAIRAISGAVTFPPGTAGLPTLRLTCALVADTGELRNERQVVFRNTNYVDRVGWREVTAVGDRTTLVNSDVRAKSSSNRLTAYPADLLSSPLDLRSATVRARPGGPPATELAGMPGIATLRAPQPRGVDAATRAFTALVARQRLNVGFGLVALGLAGALGAVHALAPGHGKTVMAAYLVGQRGSLRQAALIGLTVTATHTVGVLVLGIILSTSTSLAPESIYPWLGLTSGLMLAAIGVGLATRALHRCPLVLPAAAVPALVSVGVAADAAGHAHADHDHNHADHNHADHDHNHADHGQADADHGQADADHGQAVPDRRQADPDHDQADADHGQADADHGQVDADDRPNHRSGPHHVHHHGGRDHAHSHPVADGRDMSWKTLVPMGLAGGMVPSPSALVVLLGAIALGRAWFGVALVTAYGLGMAATLTGAGLLLVRARGSIERRLTGPRTGRLATLAQALPLITAAAIIAGGLYLATRSLVQL